MFRVIGIPMGQFKKVVTWVCSGIVPVQVPSLHLSCVTQDRTHPLCLRAFSCKRTAIIVPTLGSPRDLNEIMPATRFA